MFAQVALLRVCTYVPLYNISEPCKQIKGDEVSVGGREGTVRSRIKEDKHDQGYRVVAFELPEGVCGV